MGAKTVCGFKPLIEIRDNVLERGEFGLIQTILLIQQYPSSSVGQHISTVPDYSHLVFTFVIYHYLKICKITVDWTDKIL